MRKLISVFFVFCLAGVPFSGGQETVYRDKVYAVVEDEVITLFDIKMQTRRMERRLSEQVSGREFQRRVQQLRRQVARRMVQNQLCYEEFKKRELEVPDDYLENRIDSVVKSQADGSYKKFEEMLASDNMTLDDVREKIKKQLASQLLRDQLIGSQVKVTPQEVKEYFTSHAEEFGQPARVKLGMIFLKEDEGSDENSTSLKQRLKEMNKKLEEGVSFKDIAKDYSDNEQSAKKGGDLGWLKKQSCRDSFKQAIEGLGKGDVTEPIKEDEGVYLLKVMDKQAEQLPELTDKRRKEIREKLEKRERQKKYKELIDRLKEKFYVKMYF